MRSKAGGRQWKSPSPSPASLGRIWEQARPFSSRSPAWRPTMPPAGACGGGARIAPELRWPQLTAGRRRAGGGPWAARRSHRCHAAESICPNHWGRESGPAGARTSPTGAAPGCPLARAPVARPAPARRAEALGARVPARAGPTARASSKDPVRPGQRPAQPGHAGPCRAPGLACGGIQAGYILPGKGLDITRQGARPGLRRFTSGPYKAN